MDCFIDREKELETLQNEYERTGASIVIMYGGAASVKPP